MELRSREVMKEAIIKLEIRPTPKGLNKNDPGCNPGEKKHWGKAPEKGESDLSKPNPLHELIKEQHLENLWNILNQWNLLN